MANPCKEQCPCIRCTGDMILIYAAETSGASAIVQLTITRDEAEFIALLAYELIGRFKHMGVGPADRSYRDAEKIKAVFGYKFPPNSNEVANDQG